MQGSSRIDNSEPFSKVNSSSFCKDIFYRSIFIDVITLNKFCNKIHTKSDKRISQLYDSFLPCIFSRHIISLHLICTNNLLLLLQGKTTITISNYIRYIVYTCRHTILSRCLPRSCYFIHFSKYLILPSCDFIKHAVIPLV